MIAKGTTISTTECPGCGAELPVKVNSAGGVYFYCARVLGTNPGTGKPEKCLTRLNIGRTGSKKMIEQFLANKQDVTHHAEPALPEQPGAVETEPAPAATADPGDDAGNTAGNDGAGSDGVTAWF